MNALAAALAALAVRRPAALVALALFLVAGSLLVLRSNRTFDSEILNLLPAGTPSVEGLRIFNSEFAQSRELVFLIEGPDDGAEAFVSELKKQPWAVRVLDAAPTESPEGRSTLPALAAPLLLSGKPELLEKAARALDPGAVSDRIDRLARATAAGSPLARFELANDPLGVLTPLAAELSSRLALEETFAVQAGDARIVPVITNQPDISAAACSRLMTEVHAFVAAFVGSTPGMKIGVTGRSAYVDEISSSMQRDITLTSLVSMVAITVLFWFSFRSLVPLIGSVLILGFTCLLSLAAGLLVFERLNVVAMGFCSILVGLGDDFSLLLYQRYMLERKSGASREAAIASSIRHSTPGIFWGGLTTSLGFLTLVFSGSAGFGQLGVLIAMGVVISAAAMILFMPLFERTPPRDLGSDPVATFCRMLFDRRLFVGIVVLFVAATIVALMPWRPLEFDTSPRSLEPRNIPAARTLGAIMDAFPDAAEPIMVVVPRGAAPETIHSVEAALGNLRAQGTVTSVASPLPLLPDTAAFKQNNALVQGIDWAGLDAALNASGERNMLRPEALQPARDFLAALRTEQSMTHGLPSFSPWWFVIDRMVSPRGDAIFYVRPPAGNGDARARIEQAVRSAAPGVYVTGWTQMLVDLVPWATRELVTFGSAVILIVLVVMIITYRNARLVLLHVASLALSLVATAALLKVFGQGINLLNVLAFPLILAVGVDYGVHLVLASREPGDAGQRVAAVMKPILISGLTTVAGFGALVLADNPSLSGLGRVCATGVACCLAASLGLLAPALVFLAQRTAGAAGRTG